MMIIAAATTGILSILNGKLGDVLHTMQIGMVVIAVVAVVHVMIKPDRSMAKLLSHGAMGAFAIILAVIPTFFSNAIGKEVTNSNVTAPVVSPSGGHN